MASVGPLDRPVAVPGQDLGLPAAHGARRGGGARRLRPCGSGRRSARAAGGPAAGVGGGVDLAEQLLGEIGGADLAGRVAGVRGRSGCEPSLVRSSRSCARPAAGGGSDRAGRPCGPGGPGSPAARGGGPRRGPALARRMAWKWSTTSSACGSPSAEPAGVTGVGIRGRPRRWPPATAPGGQPATRKPRCAVRPGTTSRRRWRSRSTKPVTNSVGCSAVAARNECSSTPSAVGTPQPGQMIDPWAAVVAHRGHGGVPANPEVPGHLRDRVPSLTHPPADLGSGPLGQRRPRRDASTSSDHVPTAQSGIRATPQALGPHQHHRPIGRSADPAPSPPAAVAHRPRATPLAAHHLGGRLHHQPQLAAHPSWAPTTNPACRAARSRPRYGASSQGASHRCCLSQPQQ